MTAAQQLLRAHELGHDIYVHEATETTNYGANAVGRGTLQAKCTCGWFDTRGWRSRKALNAVFAWHLGKVIADDGDSMGKSRRNGGGGG
jgi:hypothetical protein